MKQFYKQPTMTVTEFAVEDVLTESMGSEDTYFNLNWITGDDDKDMGGF